MDGKAKAVFTVIGLLSIVFGLLGIWYNSVTITCDFSDSPSNEGMDYFYPAFYAMSGICIICYLVLIFLGISFVRLKTGYVDLFIGLLVFEIVYNPIVAMLWAIPGIGMSVGGATGVANGGLTPQEIVLFPLWAPILIYWAKNKHSKTPPKLPQLRADG